MASGPAPDLRAWLAGQFTRSVEVTAANLRELADEIERHGQAITSIPQPGRTNAGEIASQIISDVTSGLANAGLSGIVSAAARFDAGGQG